MNYCQLLFVLLEGKYCVKMVIKAQHDTIYRNPEKKATVESSKKRDNFLCLFRKQENYGRASVQPVICDEFSVRIRLARKAAVPCS